MKFTRTELESALKKMDKCSPEIPKIGDKCVLVDGSWSISAEKDGLKHKPLCYPHQPTVTLIALGAFPSYEYDSNLNYCLCNNNDAMITDENGGVHFTRLSFLHKI